ncbi:MAG: MBL fold metallo-hydrolase [Planctomycetes bacterium]|nr:MBL fold metallo-hydrolase [Planctomycetota bacterium]
MILEQHYVDCLSQASYFITDPRCGEAVVVDPRRDIEEYLETAERLGVVIKHVILTHFHADFLAGHLELRERTGATIYLGARAEAEYEFTRLKEGDRIELGDVRLVAMETPGHTPEGISILVYDMGTLSTDPAAVLTGDTLFIGDVGRPDLCASGGMPEEELASLMYDTLHQKLMKLPPATVVYPGHGAGSACGRAISNATSSTIGEQLETNYALKTMTRDEFIEMLCVPRGGVPKYFPHSAELNKRERSVLDHTLRKALVPLDVATVVHHANAGAQVLDVRSGDAYAACHMAGSVFIGLRGKYAHWAGCLLDPHEAVVVIAEPGEEREAVVRLGRIGYDNVVGYLDGGLDALRGHDELLASTERVDVAGLRGEFAGEARPLVIDVRQPAEYRAGHIGEAPNIPLTEFARRSHEVPTDQRVVLQCQSGYRSLIAASLLERAGWTELVDLRGGYVAWAGAGLPVTSGA